MKEYQSRPKKQCQEPGDSWSERKKKIDYYVPIRPNRIQSSGEDNDVPSPHSIKFDPFKVLGLNVRKSKLIPIKGTTEYKKLKEKILYFYKSAIPPCSKTDLQRQKLAKLAGNMENLYCDVHGPQGRRIRKDGGVEYLCNWFPRDTTLCPRNSVASESPEEYFTKKDLANGVVATEKYSVKKEPVNEVKKGPANGAVTAEREVVDLTNDYAYPKKNKTVLDTITLE